MSDKSVQAVIYSEPVHYEENGQYLDIDTTLKYEKAVDDSDVNGFVSKNGDFDVKFAQESDAGKLIAVRKDKYELSWNYRGDESEFQNSSVEIKGKGKPKSLIEESIINSSQTVNYNNISDNVDLQYIFSGVGLKENIIIRDKKDEYSYTFDITMNNLRLKINEDILEAYDIETSEVVFEIPAAYMYDSRGIRSNSVFYELTEKDDRYSLKVIADPEWLNSDERVFPVVIDPQVVTKQLRNEIASSYVVSGYPYEVNHGIESRMTVGKDSAGSGKMRSLIKFTLPALNKGDMVVDATMSLGQIGVYYYASTTPDAAINAYIINGTWTKGNVCWNNQPSLLNSYAIDYAMANKSEAQTAVQKNWNITKAVKGWYEGTVANNGIMLKSAVEDVSDMAQSCIYANYYTEDNSVTSGYPIISIAYRNNKGLEDYWTYTNASAGMAGNASVNDYSGNLVFTSADVSTSGLLMPVTIERVYNGYMANKKYEDVKPYVGREWKLNIQQTVRTTDMTNYPYVYEDGDGTEHYFYKKSDSEIIDEDGLGLMITRTSTGYTISDKKDKKMFFNSIGNLRKIVDSNGNYMEITYASDNKTITSVKDGSGHIISLTRNSNDYLTTLIISIMLRQAEMLRVNRNTVQLS